MTSTRDFHLPNFLFELNILSNDAEYPKRLVCLLYPLPPFTTAAIRVVRKRSRDLKDLKVKLEKKLARYCQDTTLQKSGLCIKKYQD